jgi:hypothetical protein
MSEFPDKAREWPALDAVTALTAGNAAATIMRQGIAAQTSSVARLCREDAACEAARCELQIAKNIAVNTPAATRTHAIRIISLISHALAH